MECNKEEAFRAKETAERRFAKKDFAGAKKYAVKAQKLYPELDGISQMLATFDVYVASEIQINGEIDFYAVLGLNSFADEDAIRKQYRKLALMLHPDKNKTVGADGAFKLVSEAWTLLSDSGKRSSYDQRRNKPSSANVVKTNSAAVQKPIANGSRNCTKTSSHDQPKPQTFWTACSSCKVQYEYLRKYLNNKLSCKNCRRTFVAVETGKAPTNGSIPFCSWSFAPENLHGNHGFGGITYFPANTIFVTGSAVPGFYSGFGYEYPHMTFQWSPFPGTSAGTMTAHGSTTPSAGVTHQVNNTVKRTGEKIKTAAREKDLKKNLMSTASTKTLASNAEPPTSKAERPEKKRKVDESASINGYKEKVSKTETLDSRMANKERNVGQNAKPYGTSEAAVRCHSVAQVNGNVGSNAKPLGAGEAPVRRSGALPFDARQLLINKARTEIRKKLEEIKLAAAAAVAAAATEEKSKIQNQKSTVLQTGDDLGVSVNQSVSNGLGSTSITVPDSDFHDFDKDRLEECFKPKQIWAIYDEEDGMPRLYCLIRQVISVKPFKVQISYLNSKSDSEFGLVNWVDSGFTKSCGNFRAWNTAVIEQVNIFSHVLCGQKAGRGGCIRIFPKRGDIWAVYRNWSPDWNRTTPDEVRHHYEMVEVLDDYTEELGVCVSPLVKLEGFKTVYQKNVDNKAIRWIPRREMVRFSHQVPSWSLRETSNLPEGCWDLDPAATPDELLNS